MLRTKLTHGASKQLSDKRYLSYCGKVIPASRIRSDRMLIVCPNCYRVQNQKDASIEPTPICTAPFRERMNEIGGLTDAELQDIIRRASRLSHQHRTIEDLEDAELSADMATLELSVRHPLGVAGREGLPDQG